MERNPGIIKPKTSDPPIITQVDANAKTVTQQKQKDPNGEVKLAGKTKESTNQQKKPTYFCMAKYFNIHVSRGEGAPVGDIIDAAIRGLHEVDQIIKLIRSNNLHYIFFTNKYLGTTTFLTTLSRTYTNYCFLNFNPAHKDTEEDEGHYEKLKEFIKNQPNNWNNKESIIEFLKDIGTKEPPANNTTTPVMVLIDDFDIALVKLYEEEEITLKDLNLIRNSFIKAVIENNTKSQSSFQIVLTLRKRAMWKNSDLELYNIFEIKKIIKKTSLRELWDVGYFNQSGNPHRGAFFVELLWYLKNKKNQTISEEKFYKCDETQGCEQCSLRINKEEIEGIEGIFDELSKKMKKYEEKNKEQFERIGTDAKNQAIEQEELKKLRTYEGKKRVDQTIGENLSNLFEIFENNPYFILKPMLEVIELGKKCFDDNLKLQIDKRVRKFFCGAWKIPANEKSPDESFFSDYFEVLPLYLADFCSEVKGKIEDNIIDNKVVEKIDDIKTLAGKWLTCMIKHVYNKGSDKNSKLPDGFMLEDGMVCTTLSRYKGGGLSDDEQRYLKEHKQVVRAISALLTDCRIIYEVGSSEKEFNTKICEKLLTKMKYGDLTPEEAIDINTENYPGDKEDKKYEGVRIYHLNKFIRYIYSKNQRVFVKDKNQKQKSIEKIS